MELSNTSESRAKVWSGCWSESQYFEDLRRPYLIHGARLSRHGDVWRFTFGDLFAEDKTPELAAKAFDRAWRTSLQDAAGGAEVREGQEIE